MIDRKLETCLDGILQIFMYKHNCEAVVLSKYPYILRKTLETEKGTYKETFINTTRLRVFIFFLLIFVLVTFEGRFFSPFNIRLISDAF